MKRLSFFDLFPPPDFLNMPAVGISVERDMVRVVSFGRKHGHVFLKFAEEYPIETDAVVGGEIMKSDAIKEVLKKIRSAHGVKFVRLALPEEKAYVYETVIPVPEGGEFKEAVEFSIDQNIPLAPSDVIFDFSIVGTPFISNEVQSARIMVSAYPKALAETWVHLLEEAHLTPTAFIKESQALARATVVKDEKRTVLAVHFFKDKTVIAVVSEGFVRFTTTVTNSLEHFDAVVAEKGSVSGQKPGVISESVELITVRDEIKKVCSYWASRDEEKGRKEARVIASLVVTGHVGQMNDVAEYLGERIGVPAMLGNVWVNALSLNQQIPKIEFEESLRYAVAIGAALQ